jgi:ERCC4-related helicase
VVAVSADVHVTKAAADSVAMNGQTQKQQQAVVEAFRKGTVNVLVATCIGEEGLDIGSVDLVVFYDSVGSPIR